MTNILLTGSSGFIGTNLLATYRASGYNVIGLDKKPGADIQLDLSQASLEDLIHLLSNVDIVNHHAAQVDVRMSLDNPIYDAQENILATLKLLEASKRAGVKRFIFASSGGAIGDTDYPATPYGIAKLTIEKYLHFFSFFFDTVSLRYSNVYGSHQESGIVAIMFKKALQSERLTINGNGTQTRDFIYVEDVAAANISALTSAPGIYNISTGKATSLLELAQYISHLAPLEFIYGPTILGEVQDSCIIPSGPQNWNPSTSLEEGLRKTFEYYRSVY